MFHIALDSNARTTIYNEMVTMKSLNKNIEFCVFELKCIEMFKKHHSNLFHYCLQRYIGYIFSQFKESVKNVNIYPQDRINLMTLLNMKKYGVTYKGKIEN